MVSLATFPTFCTESVAAPLVQQLGGLAETARELPYRPLNDLRTQEPRGGSPILQWPRAELAGNREIGAGTYSGGAGRVVQELRKYIWEHGLPACKCCIYAAKRRYN